MPDFTMTVGGQAVGAEQTFDVINPATGTVFAACPDCTRSQIDTAIAAAEQAFGDWRSDESGRRKAMIASVRAIKAHMQELAELLTREQGKPRQNALHEISGAAYCMQLTAGMKTPRDVLQDDENARVEVQRKPLGVVAAITPWNYPVILAMWKIAPALLAGNTVVLKPSPYTPLTTLKLGEILRDVFPPGVLNVVSGGDELGAWMTTHAAVKKISLTGSVDTGKQVAHAAAADLKRVVLELGGNDPAIVLPDVDVKAMAEKLLWGAFDNSGQVCQAIKRLYVHEAVYEPLLQEIAELARGLKVGDGLEPATQLGPINNRLQFERVIGLVEDAKRTGARMVTGGEPLPGPGYFYPPTLVTEISDQAPLVAEEQFGPVLPVLTYKKVEDALERANATHFGLGGSVWTRDLERGAELVSHLECGSGWVNQHNAFHPKAPLGGVKWSGMGYENGMWGLEAFCTLQVISVAR